MYRSATDTLASIETLKCCEVPTHEGAPPLISTGGCGGDWTSSFDSANWATCSNRTCAMAGLIRNDAETLSNLEGAVCVPSGGPSVSCRDVDISIAFDSASWASCADGEYLNGLYRVSKSNNLDDVDSIRCCKGGTTDTWSNCEEYSIASAFDIASTVSCPGATVPHPCAHIARHIPEACAHALTARTGGGIGLGARMRIRTCMAASRHERRLARARLAARLLCRGVLEGTL